jgi:hypothetical protein
MLVPIRPFVALDKWYAGMLVPIRPFVALDRWYAGLQGPQGYLTHDTPSPPRTLQ